MVIKDDWYRALVDDLKSAITESVFNSRWALIEGYYYLGQRIIEARPQFKAQGMRDGEIVQCIADAIEKSPRTVYQSIQLVRKYPKMDMLPDGKNISWYKLCNKYLPEPREKETIEKQARVCTCPICGNTHEPTNKQKRNS